MLVLSARVSVAVNSTGIAGKLSPRGSAPGAPIPGSARAGVYSCAPLV